LYTTNPINLSTPLEGKGVDGLESMAQPYTTTPINLLKVSYELMLDNSNVLLFQYYYYHHKHRDQYRSHHLKRTDKGTKKGSIYAVETKNKRRLAKTSKI
jgi:hypothetical protein